MDEEFESDRSNQPGMAHARGDMRDSMFLHASMRLASEDAPVALRVRNLSAGGLMADCPVAVEQGQQVEVALRNIGTVPGRIAWVRGNQIGVSFLNRIDPKVARKPVGTHATEAMLVRVHHPIERRPGLKIK